MILTMLWISYKLQIFATYYDLPIKDYMTLEKNIFSFIKIFVSVLLKARIL